MVECEKATDRKEAASLATGTNVPFLCMSSISPSKFVLFFETELEMLKAIDEASPLWIIFVNVRKRSDEECYS